ncbi:hypothetical protein [Phocaeicola vulgatus]|jgi:hypothetical protein|uniref:Uncharacterized protein n=1 Tax=Phocaeicola vulgatus TaxID=821 RepID=A0A412QY30_PHOVU|nr:hypothetical protein [Phocaeicola vulgatus]MCG0152695.1 hypothetical protein [Phocaeicola vulgatus]MCG0326857.1 hypothetical protein [Phocaeicola vulgatus]MCG0330515.1 hypothetical protein [Phocaeicola vulgatus]RGT96114.1 hypothetical protein DWX04_05205 [Phocaeicola vulgatus]
MSIRSNALPVGRDLSPELQDILRRNGMQAHIIRQGENYLLAVQGHDSPLLTYHISARQIRDLADWGTNSANKKAYNTFADLVKKDFYMPRDFVHARNANGRVAMGLHGYRIGVGEYGRLPWDRQRAFMMMDPFHGRFLGWTPRNQEGFHMRRVGGAMFLQGAPMVPERPDGRIKPGELLNGGYGFYYKGGQQNMVQQHSEDVLAGLEAVIPPIKIPSRPQEPAKTYKELITSDVYFSNEKWQECLSSHGVIIDANSKTLTIQSATTQHDLVYDLTDEELTRLTDNSIKNAPVQSRLDIINNVIKNDFSDKLTMDMLNSREQIALNLTPEVEAELNARQEVVAEHAYPLTHGNEYIIAEQEDRSIAHVDGNSLYDINQDKGWFREGRNGREVQVDDIRVEPVRNEQGEIQKDEKGNTMFRMTAVINGESISHEISQKQYDKFMAVDDYHRMKLFSKIFDEVDMKNAPGHGKNIGAMIGGALLAGLTVMRELGRDRYAPAVFVEHHHAPGPHVYFKGGVDSPQDLASRAFDAGLNAAEHGVGLGHGR